MEATSGTGRVTRERFPWGGLAPIARASWHGPRGAPRVQLGMGLPPPRCCVMPPPRPVPPVDSHRPLAPLARLGAWVFGWSGVWVSLLLLVQFAQRGLQPALQERERLQGLAPYVEARYAEAREAFEGLEAEAIAWQDPVYRERRRRIETFGLTFAEPTREAETPYEESWGEPYEPNVGPRGETSPWTERPDEDWPEAAPPLPLEDEAPAGTVWR